ncbi:MAG TPA: polyhydroxyalkanoic acid system family protein [Thermoanaerobaculia bacterium]|nr:polyhydroxyalkanoic acid system family protein [Thermoanaerobaculia bacterium]
MKLSFPHRTTPAAARAKIEALLDRLEGRHAEGLEVLDRKWTGDTLHFAFKARGMPAHGTIAVEGDEVKVEGKVPLLARPFEGKIRSAIEKEAAAIFPVRKA